MTISQNEVSRRLVGANGEPTKVYEDCCFDTLINKNPQAKQVQTVTVTNDANNQAHTITINGIDVVYTSDASGVKLEICTGLALAINNNPYLRGAVSATAAVDTVTITSTWPGLGFTFAESDANLTTSATVANGSASAVPFGVAVMGLGGYSADGEQYGAVPLAANLTAQVDTLTVVYEASTIYEIGITIEGERFSTAVVGNTDTATTCTAIAAAINARMESALAGAGYSVIASGTSGTTVTLTAEVPGKGFVVDYGTTTGTATKLYNTHTTAGPTTDIMQVLAGITVFSYDEEVTAVEGTSVSYPANAGMKVLKRGAIWVTSAETPSAGAAVFVETASGATCGRLYAATSATRIKLPLDRFSWRRYNAAAGIAEVQFFLPIP